MAIDISVIVSTRDNVEGIKQTLASLMQQTLPQDRYEIIIADDSQGRDTEEIINTPHQSDISIFYLRSDGLGYPRGRNKSIRGASGDLLLFLDDTCIAPATLLEAHIAAHKKHLHRIIRGPLMPMRGTTILEMPPFTAPQLNFTITNSSIHKVGIAQIDKFEEHSENDYQDVEMYWPLRRSKFYEAFLTSCYTFQDHQHYQPLNLMNIQTRAHLLACSAIDYYNSNPQPETLQTIKLDFPCQPFRVMLTNNMGFSLASSMLKSRNDGIGWMQATLMDAVFAYTFYHIIKSRINN